MINKIIIPDIPTYDKDKRKSIKSLYESFLKFDKKLWKAHVIYNQEIVYKNKKVKFPILGFKTRKKGDSLWILAGIHGEEPAGPNAISENISFLSELAKKIPIVLIPLCNPSGYFRNWRFINLRRAKRNQIAKSVGDSEHFLFNKKNKPKAEKPSSKEAEKLSSYVVMSSKDYPPLLELDFHEDDSRGKLYIYSQGKFNYKDPVANKIVSILKKSGFKFYKNGKTRFNQEIINGIVSDVKDGSIDELISSEKIIANGKIIKGPSAKSSIVIETTTVNIPISKRIKAHSIILRNSGRFFYMIKSLKI